MKQVLAILLFCAFLFSGCATKPFTPTEYQARVAQSGGFIGSCASDENFPYYWDCMSENSGGDSAGDADGSGNGE